MHESVADSPCNLTALTYRASGELASTSPGTDRCHDLIPGKILIDAMTFGCISL
jgi:hypothetical protein